MNAALDGASTRRRLSDKIEDAFDQACAQGQLEVAACMLTGLDLALLSQPTDWNRRQAALSLLRASHERLERLRAASPEPYYPGRITQAPQLRLATG